MGEAKRRKGFDSNYGKPKHQYFISHSLSSDNHAIYIKLAGSKGQTFSIYPILFYNNILKAMMMKIYCGFILDGFVPRSKCAFGISKDIQEELERKIGSFSDDREINQYRVKDSQGTLELLEPLKAATKKRYKPIAVSKDNPKITNKVWAVMEFDCFGDPIDGKLFDDTAILFTYESAAFVADYMSNNNLDNLSLEEVQNLYEEFDSIRNSILIMSEAELKQEIAQFSRLPQPA